MSDGPVVEELRSIISPEVLLSLRVMRPGALMVLDNVLLGDRVLDPSDESSVAMAALNDKIAADERVDCTMLGVADGVTLVRKR